jgi:Ca2+-transporting ATPase
MEKSYHSLTIDSITKELDVNLEVGLSSEEAHRRLELHGSNELISGEKIPPYKMFLLQFKDFIVFLLLGATIVSLIFGEYIEALIILVIVLLNGVLGFIQEFRAEEALEKLKELTGDDTLVIRDGKETRIDTRDLVLGDVLLMYEGETIAADARIFEASRLRVEEGLLTGESVPVDKIITPIEDEKIPIADRTNFAYMGTTTVKGRGKALVTGTGMNTEMGKIAKSTAETEEQDTPLQIQLARLGKFLGILVIVVVFIVFLAQIGRIEESLIEVVETAIAIAVSAVPEGLADAINLTLAIGVQRMARKNAVIRKLPAVETLGSVEVICTDKTGTLTQNKMTVQRLWTPDLEFVEVSGTGYFPKGNFIHKAKNEKIDPSNHKDIYQVLKAGALCNTASINYSHQKNEWACEGDPTEGALIVTAMKAALMDRWEAGYEFKKDGEIFFDSDRKRMTMVFSRKRPGLEETWAFCKGSPLIVLNYCSHVLKGESVIPLDDKLREEIAVANTKLGNQAYRVLGLAQRNLSNDLTDFTEDIVESNMTFIGLVGMIDPPRNEVADAIKKCKDAGIRIIMITGDQLDTALAIAKSLDLKPYEDTFYLAHTSSELEAMDDEEFKEVLTDLDVCARASPSIKRRIVETLQNEFGLVVAMTGDGVNDAPALKKADIGVAMGITGTDVAREASDMILMDDNFATIVSAVEEGRTIFDNMKKFIRYLLSSNFDEILVVFTATVVLGLPSPYLALGILWINLLTDGLPALALARTLALTVSVVFELFQVFVSRAPDGKSVFLTNAFNNVYLLAAVVSAFILHLFIVYVKPLADIFGFVTLDLTHWLTIAIVVLIGVILLDLVKLGQSKITTRSSSI